MPHNITDVLLPHTPHRDSVACGCTHPFHIISDHKHSATNPPWHGLMRNFLQSFSAEVSLITSAHQPSPERAPQCLSMMSFKGMPAQLCPHCHALLRHDPSPPTGHCSEM